MGAATSTICSACYGPMEPFRWTCQRNIPSCPNNDLAARFLRTRRTESLAIGDRFDTSLLLSQTALLIMEQRMALWSCGKTIRDLSESIGSFARRVRRLTLGRRCLTYVSGTSSRDTGYRFPSGK